MKEKNVLIIQNITHEGPGLISQLLDENSLKYKIIDLSKELLFPDINEYDLIIIMGGPDSANDTSEKIIREMDYVKLCLKNRIPLFGI